MLRFRKALTLVETLLLIIIVLLLLLLMSTGVAGSCNPDNLNAVCASNLRGLGQAMYIYAQDTPFTFPAIAGLVSDGQMRIFDPVDRVTMPPMGAGVPSPTVDMWVVLRAQNATAKQFICPWTDDEPDPAMWPQDYYDFLSADNLSYAYQYQHDVDRRLLGTSSPPQSPLMADSNPYIKGGVDDDIYDDRLSSAKGNSTNHRLRSRGQNVLFQDGHVDLTATPAVGLYGEADPSLGTGGYGFDNIYTVYDPAPPVYVDPGTYAPTETWCNAGGRSDACLVP